MGGAKPTRMLAGRPLIAYPLAAVAATCDRTAVVAKPDTELPALAAERWDEPAEPRHPLTGIVYALERAGEPVLVCAADMPFVTAAACRTLLAAPLADAVVGEAEGRPQPVFGVYSPQALGRLRAAPPDSPLYALLARLDVARVPLPAAVVRSVDTSDELAAAERELAAR
jgi:molybdenum cofactor guanylyltransferase